MSTGLCVLVLTFVFILLTFTLLYTCWPQQTRLEGGVLHISNSDLKSLCE